MTNTINFNEIMILLTCSGDQASRKWWNQSII